VRERERERERRIFSREAKGQFSSTHTHTQRPTRRKKICQVKKRKVSSPPLGRSRPLPQRERSRGSFQVVLSLSRSTGGKRRRSIDRSRRARAAKWDIGSLGSRTPPVVKRDDPQNRSREMGGGARSFKPNTPMNARAHRKLFMERFCFRRRKTRER
jgi:hypothetical protein